MELYGIPYSPECGRVQFALEQKELDHKFHAFTPKFSDRALTRAAGRVELPTLLDKHIILRGGDEILDYLETDHPGVNLRGTDEKQVAAIARYVSLYHEIRRGLQADVLIRFRRNIDAFGKDTPFGIGPKFLREKSGNWVIDRLDELWNSSVPDFQKNREKITSQLRSLTAQMRPGQPLVGMTITDADICFSELGVLFRPEEDGRNDISISLLNMLQAEWVTSEIVHPYEVWRDGIRRLAENG